MKLKMYCVYDCKVEAYLQPFFMRTRGEALRAWQQTCNDPQTAMCVHPSDYTLFEIGEFDDGKGVCVMYDSKVSLGLALEFKKPDVALQNENVTELSMKGK